MKNPEQVDLETYELLLKSGEAHRDSYGNMCKTLSGYIMSKLREAQEEAREAMFDAAQQVGFAANKRSIYRMERASVLELDVAMAVAQHRPELLEGVLKFISGENNGHRGGIHINNLLDVTKVCGVPLELLPEQAMNMIHYGDGLEPLAKDTFCRFYESVQKKGKGAVEAVNQHLIQNGIKARKDVFAVAQELGLEDCIPPDVKLGPGPLPGKYF